MSSGSPLMIHVSGHDPASPTAISPSVAERELDLRERELRLKEMELQFKMSQMNQVNQINQTVIQQSTEQILQLPEGRYVGATKNGQPHGHGRIDYEPNEKQYVKYEGDFIDGKKDAKGELKWLNGTRYSGDFKHDTMNGMGVKYDANGNRYEGAFVNGVVCGHATFQYRSGERYVGQFKNNLYNGKGEYWNRYGQRTEIGEYKDDKLWNGKRIGTNQNAEITSSTPTYSVWDGKQNYCEDCIIL